MLELHLRPMPTDDHPDENEPAAIVISRFPCVLGRNARCDEHIDDLMVSRQHCKFILRDDWVWVEDLASRNGTVLNGERLSRAMPIGDGDVFQVGQRAYQVQLQNAPVGSLASPFAPAGH
jgi:pSer/pThr/pTyr-binding forkhead associated (FHA) protein